MTGSYNNNFHVVSTLGDNYQYELNYKKNTVVKSMGSLKTTGMIKLDSLHKTTAVGFHP